MLKYGDTVKIKTIVKLYGRGEGLVAMLEEIKSKDMTGKVISIDKEDCILDTYVSFEGYDNIWMSEEDELEKVSAYDNLKIVENIDNFIETLKNMHEEGVEEVKEERVGEIELEEVELDKKSNRLILWTKEVDNKEVDDMDKKLLNYLIAKFNYGSIEEVLDDYYEDKLVEYIRKDNMLFEDKDEFVVMRTVETILDLFELNRDDIKEALDKKEMKRIVRKMNDDDLEF